MVSNDSRLRSNNSKLNIMVEEPINENQGLLSHRSARSGKSSALENAQSMINFIKIGQSAKKNLNVQASVEERQTALEKLTEGVHAFYFSYISAHKKGYKPELVKINQKKKYFTFFKVAPKAQRSDSCLRLQGEKKKGTIHKSKLAFNVLILIYSLLL